MTKQANEKQVWHPVLHYRLFTWKVMI